MMDFCTPAEDIIRAIQSAHFDPKNRRVSPNLFEGTNNSVSRLKILPLEEILAIFRQTLHNPPRVSLMGAGEISVEALQKVGAAYKDAIRITVKICPTKRNPAHAEIPQKISRGLAKQIIRVLKFYDQNGQPLSDF